jgi:hypothetical protein
VSRGIGSQADLCGSEQALIGLLEDLYHFRGEDTPENDVVLYSQKKYGPGGPRNAEENALAVKEWKQQLFARHAGCFSTAEDQYITLQERKGSSSSSSRCLARVRDRAGREFWADADSLSHKRPGHPANVGDPISFGELETVHNNVCVYYLKSVLSKGGDEWVDEVDQSEMKTWKVSKDRAHEITEAYLSSHKNLEEACKQ